MEREQEALAFIRELASHYFEHRDMAAVGSFLEERTSWIGTGRNELSRNLEEAQQALAQESEEYGGAFRITQLQCETATMQGPGCIIYGTVTAEPENLELLAENVRFTAVTEHTQDGNENQVYEGIRQTVAQAQQQIYSAVNFAMVQTYWEIGRQIIEAQNRNERAEYGAGLLKYLSEHLTAEFGKGYTVSNLQYMRAFYTAFPIQHALRGELSWTHYRLLLKVEDENARRFYLEECAKSHWSTRQLERQINTFFYQRLLERFLKVKRA